MTARLAKPTDAALIDALLRTRKQVWAPEAIAQAITSDRYIMVVDPPDGLFWAWLSESAKNTVEAGITFARDDAQTRDLYRAALVEADKRWKPMNTWTLIARIDATKCQAQAYRGATAIAGMAEVSSANVGWKPFKVTWDVLKAGVGVERVR